MLGGYTTSKMRVQRKRFKSCIILTPAIYFSFLAHCIFQEAFTHKTIQQNGNMALFTKFELFNNMLSYQSLKISVPLFCPEKCCFFIRSDQSNKQALLSTLFLSQLYENDKNPTITVICIYLVLLNFFRNIINRVKISSFCIWTHYSHLAFLA